MDEAPPLPLVPIGVDSETALILPGNLAPALVCVSTAERAANDFQTNLYLRDDGLSFYHRVLEDSSRLLVIHNASFDLAVACNEDAALVPKVFDAYAEGRVCCTITLQKVIDVALGMRKFRRYGEPQRVAKTTYFLADLILLYCDEQVAKADTWRKSYALLQGVPLSEWPPSAKRYAIYDAVLHLRLYEAQQALIAHTFGGDLPDQVPQQQAAWALHLMGMWGVRAEKAAVEKFIAHCRVEIDKMHRDLDGTGIFKPRYRCRGKCLHRADEPWQVCPSCGGSWCRLNPEAGSRSMKEIRRRVVEACGRLQIAVPMTDPSDTFPEGQVQTDKEALEQTDDVALHVLAAQMTFEKHLGQWGPVCEAAVERPVCARYDVLVETGRTSCSGSEGQEGTNFQNPPRKGDVRPCFIPRKGWVFASTDADVIELRAQAQNCLEMFGWSKMAEALWDQHKNGGPDLHVRLGANLVGVTAEELDRRKKDGDAEAGEARQFAKIPGYGLWGGLGPETLVFYAAAQVSKATHRKWFGETRAEQIAKATWIREVWFETWPEARIYFKKVGGMIPKGGDGVIQQLMSGRIRGGVRFTAAANGFFQGRVADAMKDVLFHLANECYTARCATKHAHGGSSLCTIQGRSVLGGSRPMLFLHDEPILEHPEDGSESDRAERQRQVVVEGLSRWMPDIPCTSQAVLMRRWQKGAEPLFVGGKLVPVCPEKVVVDGKIRVRWMHDFGERV